MRLGEHWVRQGMAGWRLDVPYELQTEGFWQEFRDRIKAINPKPTLWARSGTMPPSGSTAPSLTG